jgi:hypothetical protein
MRIISRLILPAAGVLVGSVIGAAAMAATTHAKVIAVDGNQLPIHVKCISPACTEPRVFDDVVDHDQDDNGKSKSIVVSNMSVNQGGSFVQRLPLSTQKPTVVVTLTMPVRKGKALGIKQSAYFTLESYNNVVIVTCVAKPGPKPDVKPCEAPISN